MNNVVIPTDPLQYLVIIIAVFSCKLMEIMTQMISLIVIFVTDPTVMIRHPILTRLPIIALKSLLQDPFSLNTSLPTIPQVLNPNQQVHPNNLPIGTKLF